MKSQPSFRALHAAALAAALAFALTACGGGSGGDATPHPDDAPTAPDPAPTPTSETPGASETPATPEPPAGPQLAPVGVYEGTLTSGEGAGTRTVDTIVLPSGEYYQLYTAADDAEDWSGVVRGMASGIEGAPGLTAADSTQYKLDPIARTRPGVTLDASYDAATGQLDGTQALNVDAMSADTASFDLTSTRMEAFRLVVDSMAQTLAAVPSGAVLFLDDGIIAVQETLPGDALMRTTDFWFYSFDGTGGFEGAYWNGAETCQISGTLGENADAPGIHPLQLTFDAGCTTVPVGQTWTGVAIVVAGDPGTPNQARGTVVSPDGSRAMLITGKFTSLYPA